MRVSTSSIVVVAFLSTAILTACGGSNNGLSSSTPMSVAPQFAGPLSLSRSRITGERTYVRPAYSVLYSFKGGSEDGANPYAALLDINGELYGTTDGGGANSAGTVFTITTSGKETVLYSFKGPPDGQQPQADLLSVKGTLYGTTYEGGAYNSSGTVFAITTSGTETVLHSFSLGSGDGANPQAGLVNVKGALYGTTTFGGLNPCSGEGCGTIFSITTHGKETVLYGFNEQHDGEYPLASLINVKGTLYGTTYQGGAITCSSQGCGTAFSITPSGAETVLHSFGGSGDGKYPDASLVNVNGALYGTTQTGGAKGRGTVFLITPSRKETVLHSFKGGSGDGEDPDAGLTNVNGKLYGTTSAGGTNNEGTVYTITTSGKETVLHSFKGGSGDGDAPWAGLINVNGTLYGTTKSGGANDDGTVFSLSPVKRLR
jgi:uncharacterized repeat protein (TIGR03803 family)